MRSFGTQGRVRPKQHYIVPRTAHVSDFITRIRAGKYIVLFAPRQTGKTTFFRLALNRLVAEDPTYFPIHLNFEVYEDCTPIEFYGNLIEHIREEIEHVFQKQEQAVPEAFTHFLENTHLTNQLSLRRFFRELGENFRDYLTPTGALEIERLLDNFQAFIARAGFRILQVPDTPQEYVGQYLLYAYLDHFVRIVGADMFLEVQTGRGRIDLLILHNQRKYIVETKIWEGDRYYQSGKAQLAAYLKLEDAQEGYYVVFDHRQQPASRAETETIDGAKIRSYVIPVMQERPSSR